MAKVKEVLKALGPGMIITASFIGPGTVTSMTRAGASFEYALLWAVVFSVITTIVLQEMVIRLSLVTREGLGEAITELFNHKVGRLLTVWISLVAVTLGCAAYISGDLLGTTLGVSYMLGVPEQYVAPIFGLIILTIGLMGSYKVIERLMIVLLVIMGGTFVTAMFAVKPDWGEVAKGALIPSIPSGSIIMVIALIGTTVVPYNFFLHSTSVFERFGTMDKLKLARWDTVISIVIGGIISGAIMIVAGTVIGGTSVDSILDMADPLEPILGNAAPYFISIGLFAAGFSSALASPMGAAATIGSFFRWKGGIANKKFKIVFTIIIVIGITTSLLGFESLEIIMLAQALNGMILPIISILMLIIVNKKSLLKNHTNGLLLNIIGFIVVAIVTALGFYSMYSGITGLFDI